MTEPNRFSEGGFRHVAAFYDSDAAFLDVVSSFLADTATTGDATLAALSPDHADLVRSELPGFTDITFLPSQESFCRPASAIRAYRDLFAEHIAAGAAGIRILGEVPNPGPESPWEDWACYESAINRAYAGFPLCGLCTYDRRTTPDDIIDCVERTHPHVVSASGYHVRNRRYEDPANFLADRPRHAPDVLEDRPADVELINPEPAAARRAVAQVSQRAGVGLDHTDDLCISVNEVVTNAILYGQAPTVLRAWAGPGRILVTVHDRGGGPSDPFAGLMPAAKENGEGGYGLWIAHQLCHRVTLDSDPDGFTVRMVVGRPAPR